MYHIGYHTYLTQLCSSLLPGIVAALIPLAVLDVADKSFTLVQFCEMLGINRQAKYLIAAIANRKKYNASLDLNGEIAVGEMVVCRGGEGELIAREDDGSLTIKLLPWGTVKTNKSITAAQMRRLQPSFNKYECEERSDVTPAAHKSTIEKFFRKHVPMSPEIKDTVKIRHLIWPTQYQEAQALHRTETMSELWSKFEKEHADLYGKYKDPKKPKTAPKVFRENAPFEMVRAPTQSCLCINCEDVANVLRGSATACALIDDILDKAKAKIEAKDPETVKAAAQLRLIKKIISSPSKYDAMVACMGACLPTGKLEDAKYECLYGNCEECGFARLWSCGLRELLLDENGALREGAPLNSADWKIAKIHWRYFTHSIAPTEANHALEVARQAASARAAAREGVNANNDEYRPSESKAKPTCILVLATKKGDLVDYLDEFDAKSHKHLVHRNKVSNEFRAKTNYDQNLRPFIVTKDQDFAENGNVQDRKQVQSQYWVTIMYTLFISIMSWLSAAAWNKTEGELAIEDEVTVYGEMAGDPINMDSFWATVTKVIDAATGKYEVTAADGKTHQVDRADLRHRKKVTIAFGHVTPDKKHDRHAMQKFTTTELQWLTDFMIEKYPDDIPDRRIKRLHTHSDNAAQHFKSTGSMNFYTTLGKEHPDTANVYSFGAENHGKGKHDGVGGIFKTKVNRSLESSEKEPLKYTTGGYITGAYNAYEALVHHFELGVDRDKQASSRNAIGHYKFFYYGADLDANDINPIQRPEETFSRLEGISIRQQFAVRGEGDMYQRMRSC